MTSVSTATHIPTGDSRVRRCAVLLGSLLFVSVLLATPASAQKSIIVNPHGDLSLPVDCSACHTSESFVPARRDMDFDHNRQTTFPLLGRHTDVACATCHLDLRFDEPEIEPTACASCHVDVHQASMIESCATCHNTSSFSDVDGLAIHNQTSFPLTGAHEQIICESCHVDDVGGAFSALDPSCESCHQDDYAAATSIDHVGLGFPQTCENCHSTRMWGSGDLFDHTTASGGFELVGAHANARCSSCHMSPGLQPIFEPASPDDCYTCHESDYQREHAGSGFPTTCQACHTGNDWDAQEGSFDHAIASGGFELVGAHENASCSSCHNPGDFSPLFAATSNDDCFTCHQSDYQTEHAGSGFPTTCTTCHGTTAWSGLGSFDHATASGGFDLVGAHVVAACESCHAPQTFEPLFAATSDDDCLTCHQPDYETEHGGSGFPTTCTTCHGTDSWTGSGTFDHAAASGGFDLVGAHVVAACESCHAQQTFEPLFAAASNDDCFTCHQSEYETEHGGTGFPTTCATCHGNDTWTGARFDNHDQDYFPIYSGTHRSEWDTCQTCHTNQGNFEVFTCLTCHEHSQARMDDKHSERNGYVYESTACLSCHPRGNN